MIRSTVAFFKFFSLIKASFFEDISSTKTNRQGIFREVYSHSLLNRLLFTI